MSGVWIFRRGKTYYVRAIVPRGIRPLIGKNEIWKSLHTSDKREASKRAVEPTAAIRRMFEQARQQRDALLSGRPKKRKKSRVSHVGPRNALEALQNDLDQIMNGWPPKSLATYSDFVADLASAYPNAGIAEFPFAELARLAEIAPELRFDALLKCLKDEREKRLIGGLQRADLRVIRVEPEEAN
ncbi:MAG: hypothetical protein HQ495_02400 [Alphaproteobacteria bacterium]|nr:hypothetical protein [Alphaproteobacteria bacterium]